VGSDFGIFSDLLAETTGEKSKAQKTKKEKARMLKKRCPFAHVGGGKRRPLMVNGMTNVFRKEGADTGYHRRA